MQLEMHLQEMQIDLENLMWDRKELEGHLKVATKEHRVMEMMLLELEEEHDKAIVKIELLESKVMTVLLQALSQTTPMLVILSNINIFVSFPFGKRSWLCQVCDIALNSISFSYYDCLNQIALV